ncbi:MAG: hypothetical protein V1851_00875 [Patescibacteria group bacterium]
MKKIIFCILIVLFCFPLSAKVEDKSFFKSNLILSFSADLSVFSFTITDVVEASFSRIDGGETVLNFIGAESGLSFYTEATIYRLVVVGPDGKKKFCTISFEDAK